MIGIIFWVIVILVVFYFFNKYQNKYQSFQGNVFNLIIIGFLLFFAGTGIYVYLKVRPDLGSFNGSLAFFKLYFSWLGQFFTGTRDVVGYAVSHDWGVNSTSG